jgi:hypothetical protein
MLRAGSVVDFVAVRSTKISRVQRQQETFPLPVLPRPPLLSAEAQPGCASAIAGPFGSGRLRQTGALRLAWRDTAETMCRVRASHSSGTNLAARELRRLSAQLLNGHGSRGSNRKEQGCKYHLSNHELTPFSDRRPDEPSEVECSRSAPLPRIKFGAQKTCSLLG